MIRKLQYLVHLVICSSIYSATFLPMDLPHQLKETDVVITGKYSSFQHKKMPNGEIVTEISMEIDKQVGLNPSKIVNSKNFKFLIPGGRWQGIVYKVSGTPEFKKNEEFAILLRKSKWGLYPVNLALSKFTLRKNIEGNSYISNVFSNRENIGTFSEKYFEENVENTFNQRMASIGSDKSQINLMVKNMKNVDISERSPASDTVNKSNDEKSNSIWILLLLAFVSVGAGIIKRSNES